MDVSPESYDGDRPKEITHEQVLKEFVELQDKWKGYGYRTVTLIYFEDEFANSEGFMLAHRGCGPIMAAGFCDTGKRKFLELQDDEDAEGWIDDGGIPNE